MTYQVVKVCVDSRDGDGRKYIDEGPGPGVIPEGQSYRGILEHVERLEEVAGM